MFARSVFVRDVSRAQDVIHVFLVRVFSFWGEYLARRSLFLFLHGNTSYKRRLVLRITASPGVSLNGELPQLGLPPAEVVPLQSWLFQHGSATAVVDDSDVAVD